MHTISSKPWKIVKDAVISLFLLIMILCSLNKYFQLIAFPSLESGANVYGINTIDHNFKRFNLTTCKDSMSCLKNICKVFQNINTSHVVLDLGSDKTGNCDQHSIFDNDTKNYYTSYYYENFLIIFTIFIIFVQIVIGMKCSKIPELYVIIIGCSKILIILITIEYHYLLFNYMFYLNEVFPIIIFSLYFLLKSFRYVVRLIKEY